MPMLVNFAGDRDVYSSRLYSIGSHSDVYVPPFKLARFCVSFRLDDDDFKPQNQPSMELLPDECLFEIFRRLPSKERSSCACVSKRWLMLLSTMQRSELCDGSASDGAPCDKDEELENDGYLTRSLEAEKATDIRLAAIAVGTASRGGLGKLLIRGSNTFPGVTNLGLSAVARGCPSLKFLSLWNLPLLNNDSLVEISQNCSLLEKLDLNNCPSISDDGLISIAKYCHNLSSLSIETCTKITNEGVKAVGKLCSKLQSVSIRDCASIGDHGVSSLLSSASSVLSRVKLHSLNITDFTLAVIGHYGRAITSLVLGNLQHVSEKGFWVMGRANGLEQLISLTISSCRGITDVGFQAIAEACVNLKNLCLRDCRLLSDNGVISIVKAARALESLQLEECNKITQLGIVAALTSGGAALKALYVAKCLGIRDEKVAIDLSLPCSSLRSLSIRNCPGFGSTTLATLGTLCPQLQYLDLSGLCGITDSGLLPLLECCKAGLVKVCVSGCVNLTDKIISVLTMQHGGTLEVLNLDGCWKITDSSLQAIAQNCFFLSDLDVSKCAITDSGVGLLSETEQLNLRVLSLSSCSAVSNNSLPCLKKMGRTLVGLNLQNCNILSSSGVQLLVESLWRCDILF